ncbi:MAG: protease inhibitor I42 family protein [Armatimonadetes bacterium]|nr:protease inhibitor I42 family protein [Armatimonadota bacterium]
MNIAATHFRPISGQTTQPDSYPVTLFVDGQKATTLSGGNGSWILTMKPGTTFGVQMYENPSTGFVWQSEIRPADPRDKDYVKLDDSYFRPYQPLQDGSGGVRRFDFTSGDEKPKNMISLVFKLNMPWSETTKPVAERRLNILFKSPKDV